jgi:hypothetical protein
MKTTYFLKLAALGLTAIFCISGQSPRKEVQEVPAVQHSAANTETKNQKPVSQKAAQKSAAKRAMESDGQTSMNQKSAAKRSME